jgi:polyhydroxybutyrate depolymerase
MIGLSRSRVGRSRPRGRFGRTWAGAIAVAILSVGVGATAQASDGRVVRGAVAIDGYQRTYRLLVPHLAPGERFAGTVVVLHGGGSREAGATLAASVGFDAEATRHRLIAVYPDGRGGAFHAGHCCGTRSTRGDDVRFVMRLVAAVHRRYAVDARRTFATGFSNGAFLAYRLACQRSRRFLGVAAVAGSEVLRRCRPDRPVSVLHIHGREDHRVRFDGATLGRPWVPGAIELARRWRTRDRCPPGTTQRLRTPQLLVSQADGCRDGTQVRLVALENLGHTWPGADAAYGEPSPYNATAEIGRFFAGLPPRPAEIRRVHRKSE